VTKVPRCLYPRPPWKRTELSLFELHTYLKVEPQTCRALLKAAGYEPQPIVPGKPFYHPIPWWAVKRALEIHYARKGEKILAAIDRDAARAAQESVHEERATESPLPEMNL
jgi:hypothetical protein